MQRVSGRILLPEPGWRRFRLPTLPQDGESPRRVRRGRTAIVVALVWAGVSVLGMELTQPAAAAQARGWTLTGLVRELWTKGVPPPATEPPSSARPGRPSAAPQSPTVPALVAEPPRVVSGLTPVARQSPTTHQGMQYSSYSNLPSGFEATLERPQIEQASSAVPNALPSEPSSRLDNRDEFTEPPGDRSAALPARVWTQLRGEGCERAYDDYQQTIDVAASQGEPDVSREAFAQRLENFDAYSRCEMNQPRDISICVAVQSGVPKGVTVKTSPRDARLAACVAEAVSRMRFPASSRMDLVRSELTIR